MSNIVHIRSRRCPKCFAKRASNAPLVCDTCLSSRELCERQYTDGRLNATQYRERLFDIGAIKSERSGNTGRSVPGRKSDGGPVLQPVESGEAAAEYWRWLQLWNAGEVETIVR